MPNFVHMNNLRRLFNGINPPFLLLLPSFIFLSSNFFNFVFPSFFFIALPEISTSQRSKLFWIKIFHFKSTHSLERNKHFPFLCGSLDREWNSFVASFCLVLRCSLVFCLGNKTLECSFFHYSPFPLIPKFRKKVKLYLSLYFCSIDRPFLSFDSTRSGISLSSNAGGMCNHKNRRKGYSKCLEKVWQLHHRTFVFLCSFFVFLCIFLLENKHLPDGGARGVSKASLINHKTFEIPLDDL